MVLMVHSTIAPLGGLPNNSELMSSPGLGAIRCFLGQFAVPGVDIFILISGWFGIRLSAKGLCNILFQVLFYRLLISVIFYLFIGESIFTCIALAIPGYKDWFTASYLILMALSPFLNSLVDNSPSRAIILIVPLFAFQFIFGWLIPVWGDFNYGYSAISFTSLYLLARIMRHYSNRIFPYSNPPVLLRNVSLSITLIAGIIYLTIFLCPIEIVSGLVRRWDISYTSPINIAIGAVIILAFSRMNFQNEFINKIAQSAFAVYLVHENPLVRPFFRQIPIDAYASGSTITYFLTIISWGAATYILIAMFDRLRIWLWSKLVSAGLIDRYSSPIINRIKRLVA